MIISLCLWDNRLKNKKTRRFRAIRRGDDEKRAGQFYCRALSRSDSLSESETEDLRFGNSIAVECLVSLQAIRGSAEKTGDYFVTPNDLSISGSIGKKGREEDFAVGSMLCAMTGLTSYHGGLPNSIEIGFGPVFFGHRVSSGHPAG
jgi:hypothetical protein